MSRPTLEVPWTGTVFPQKCASCGSPTAEKTLTVERPTQAYQRRRSTGYALGGIIGMAIAGSGGAQKYVHFAVPHCAECLAQTRRLRTMAWLSLALGLLSMIVLPVIVPQVVRAQEQLKQASSYT